MHGELTYLGIIKFFNRTFTTAILLNSPLTKLFMKNPICISTGCFYHLTEDRNEAIKLARTFPVDGVEISFQSPEYLRGFFPAQDNLDYLQDPKNRVSIHAPWKNITYDNGVNCLGVLDLLQDLSHKVKAQNITFHQTPNDDLRITADYKFLSSIENDEISKGLEGITSLQLMDKALKRNPHMKITLDIAHALTISPEEAVTYIVRFKNKITQAHVSYLNKHMIESKEDHGFLHQNKSGRLSAVLGIIPQQVPLVLECVVQDKSELPLIKEEIEYLRKSRNTRFL